jgi:hypothetical protein
MEERNYEHSAFSSESDSDTTGSIRGKKKKLKAPSEEFVGSSTHSVLKVENPPKRNNRINNYYYTNSDASNASTLIHVDYDNNPPPVKKRTCSSKLYAIMSKLFCWKKKKEIATLTKEEKKKLMKKQKKRRNCCLIIFLIIIILLLLGNIAALDVAYIAYRNSLLSNLTLVDNGFTPAQEQNLKASMCSTILGTQPPLNFNCEFCWDDNSFYNVTSFCFLKSLYLNASNRTQFDNIGWLRDIDYCRWLGVRCDESKNIIELNLRAPNTPIVFDSRVGRLKSLRKLTLIGTGTFPNNRLPTSLFTMESLEELTITSTSFTGSIPNTIDKMTSLKSLQIRNNRNLTNSIPDSISKTSLISFVYGFQGLDGVIPDFIGNSPSLQQSLETLDLNSNRLTGTIPDSLMNLTKLKSLHLGSNFLTGDFPISIISSKFAKSLAFINLGGNNFTGIIPPSLAQCENLQIISLERNSFTGPIPSELSKLNLGVLILTNNKLSGPIPDSIGNLKLNLL